MLWLKPKITWHIPENSRGLLPLKATPGSMAYDLASPFAETIPPHGSILINTLVAVTLPKGYAMILGSRSGMAAKRRVTVEAGWIDNDYRGLIKVLLYNHNDTPVSILGLERIAQAMLVKVPRVKERLSFTYPDTNSTKRGAGGFGSTGK